MDAGIKLGFRSHINASKILTDWGEKAQIHPEQYRRLSPFDDRVRAQVGMLYEDLAGHAAFDGILFHDDALLSDYEDASAPAITAYQQAGFSGSLSEIRQNPEQFKQWTRFKSRALTDFTLELSARVKAIRGPHVKTARNIFALPVIQPESEAWFAQNYADFLKAMTGPLLWLCLIWKVSQKNRLTNG